MNDRKVPSQNSGDLSDKNPSKNPCNQLEKLFHEPKRLAITSALCSAEQGLVFSELKILCDLTDGNLNRHVKALQDAGAVTVIKTAKGRRSVTRIHLTEHGREHFLVYLSALENVLQQAVNALAPEERRLLRPNDIGPAGLSSAGA